MSRLCSQHQIHASPPPTKPSPLAPQPDMHDIVDVRDAILGAAGKDLYNPVKLRDQMAARLDNTGLVRHGCRGPLHARHAKQGRAPCLVGWWCRRARMGSWCAGCAWCIARACSRWPCCPRARLPACPLGHKLASSPQVLSVDRPPPLHLLSTRPRGSKHPQANPVLCFQLYRLSLAPPLHLL